MGIRAVTALCLTILCATCGGGIDASTPKSIWYSHAGCYGWCPSFEIHVSPHGRGVFEGHSYTAVKGRREFTVTRQQYDAFVQAVKPARTLAKPFESKDAQKIAEGSACPPGAPYHTDDTGVFVMWSEQEGDVYYDAYFGCDSDRNKRLYDALDNAPMLLGLKNMIADPNPTTTP
jgi:hypothetical protein